MEKPPATHSDDLLEWTISHAPTDDDLSSPESALPHPYALHIARQTWIILGGLIVVALLGAGLAFGWNLYRLRRDVAHVVAMEDEAALSGDVEQFRQLSDSADTSWNDQREQLATMGIPAPPPTRLLRPVHAPGVVKSLATINQNTIRVDVARQYTTADGTALTFILPQFYRYVNSQWKRIPPPEDAPEQQSTRTGLYTDIQYFAADADFVEKDLGPYLDDVLGRACALWDCPANLKIAVNFIRYASPYGPFYTQQPGTPLLFQLSPITFSRWPQNTLTLVSPQVMGYPADTASKEHLKRVAAIQALLVLADRLIGGADQTHNGFLYALVARTSARLGLDSPNVLSMSTTPFSRPADAIWQKQRIPNAAFDPLPSDDMQRALVILNSLLRDQPEYTDTRLLHTVNANAGQGLADWVAAGLGISADEARTRLEAAEAATYRLELDYHVAALSPAHYNLALGCDSGPALLSLNDPQPFYFLPDFHYPTNVISWSPDGKRLLLFLSAQSAIVDFTTQKVYALPNVPSGDYLQAQWIYENRVAYVTWFPAPSLNFFDFAQPLPMTGIDQPTAGIYQYEISPDKSLAAIVQDAPSGPSGQSRTEVAVMPKEGMIYTVDIGWSPSWSPDGRALAYTHFDPAGGGFSLRIANLTTGITRTLVTAVDLGINTVNQFDQTAWSPAGDKIAFTASTEMSSWIGLVNPDGSAPRLLVDHTGLSDTPRFSADGRFLAITLYDGRSPPLLTVYDVTTGNQVASLPQIGSYGWSPSGHQIVTAGYGGVFLRADPASPPQKLADGSCYNAAWKPAP